MKPVLSALALFLTTMFALGEPAKPRIVPACVKCSHAPCQCGFSPSYYTVYRKPLPHADRKAAPVGRHWSRPSPVRRRAVTVQPASKSISQVRSARVVPAPAPNQRLGYVPGRSWSRGVSRKTSARNCAVPSRSSTLMPTPRRPRAVPSPTPSTSLGYDPSRSWAHGGVVRRTRR